MFLHANLQFILMKRVSVDWPVFKGNEDHMVWRSDLTSGYREVSLEKASCGSFIFGFKACERIALGQQY